MKVLIIYSNTHSKMSSLVSSLADGLKENAHTTEQLVIEEYNSDVKLSVRRYDAVYFFIPVKSWFGKLSETIREFIASTLGLEGSKVISIVKTGLFGTNKTSQWLMKNLEQQGSFIIDCREISSSKDAYELGKKMKTF